ncbi:MAG: UvrD-helicase domain-containing protein [Bacteroidales bacterium]|nr:UvrD-helicase domain-containing protein [Bacteroidales bacterium]
MDEKAARILEGLDPQQRTAVENIHGPMLIVAGAGSGKTRVLTSRIAYILATEDIDPARILALTFTKKAAGEMKQRIAVMVGDRRAARLVMGTFHSVFVRFLRDYAESLGYPRTFTIYDQSDSTSAVKACIKELKLDDKTYKPREVLSRISAAKNALVLPQRYNQDRQYFDADSASKRPMIGRVYELYQQKLKQSGVMDFDDILVQMNILLRDNPEALEEISARFSYILVDEYQDTNLAQYLIIKKLSQRHHNISVVGDDSQSIYAFRGARIENILNFQKDYPESRILRLEHNYRSTSNIVEAANSVIEHNEGRIPKKCFAGDEKGEKLELMKAWTEQDEAIMIVSDIISRMQLERAQYQDFAVLYRTNSQSRALEEQLRRRNLPYMIYSGNSFFDRAEIKDMTAYFKLVVNINDDESFKRVVNVPARGIGDTSISALNECARAHGCPLFKAAFMQDTGLYGLRQAALGKIQAFCSMINGLAAKVPETDAYDMAKMIADASGYYAFHKLDTSIEGMARTANLDELLNSVAGFVEERQDEFADNGVPEDEFQVVTLADFLENIALLSNVDVTTDEDTNNKVALMTVHSAKGLEFPYVYVAGCEENLFPGGGMLASKQDIEEERRLFYVAVTRAKRAVSLSYACTRMRNGKHESNPPSRFLYEIDDQYLANPLPKERPEVPSSALGRFGGVGGSYGGLAGRSFSRGAGSSGNSFSRSSGSSGSSFSRNPSSGGGGYRYGKSSTVRFEPRRTSFGTSPHQESQPSPVSRPVRPTSAPPVIDADFVPVPMTELYVGERIEHNRFGAGRILEITGEAPEMKAVVEFDDYGRKQLLLKYAKLRPEKA